MVAFGAFPQVGVWLITFFEQVGSLIPKHCVDGQYLIEICAFQCICPLGGFDRPFLLASNVAYLCLGVITFLRHFLRDKIL